MNLSADEFLSLSTQLSDRDVRVMELEKQLEKTRELLLVKEAENEALIQQLVIDLKGTVDLENFPLPYEGAYAQALYLLDHGFNPQPTHEESQLITDHNRRFEEPNDCEEAIRTFLKVPDTLDNTEAMSAGDIMHELNIHGFRGREYNSIAIGKTMKRLGFEKRVIRGSNKYLVTKIDYDQHSRENKLETREFIPEIF